MKRKIGFFQKGIAQLPVVLVLVLMVIAIPATLKLTQETQETRSGAAIDAPCKECSGIACVPIRSPPYCDHSFNECSVNADCGTAVCTDGARRCATATSAVRQHCVDGQWTYLDTCDYGCDGGACNPPPPPNTPVPPTPVPPTPVPPTPVPPTPTSECLVGQCMPGGAGASCPSGMVPGSPMNCGVGGICCKVAPTPTGSDFVTCEEGESCFSVSYCEGNTNPWYSDLSRPCGPNAYCCVPELIPTPTLGGCDVSCDGPEDCESGYCRIGLTFLTPNRCRNPDCSNELDCVCDCELGDTRCVDGEILEQCTATLGDGWNLIRDCDDPNKQGCVGGSCITVRDGTSQCNCDQVGPSPSATPIPTDVPGCILSGSACSPNTCSTCCDGEYRSSGDASWICCIPDGGESGGVSSKCCSEQHYRDEDNFWTCGVAPVIATPVPPTPTDVPGCTSSGSVCYLYGESVPDCDTCCDSFKITGGTTGKCCILDGGSSDGMSSKCCSGSDYGDYLDGGPVCGIAPAGTVTPVPTGASPGVVTNTPPPLPTLPPVQPGDDCRVDADCGSPTPAKPGCSVQCVTEYCPENSGCGKTEGSTGAVNCQIYPPSGTIWNENYSACVEPGEEPPGDEDDCSESQGIMTQVQKNDEDSLSGYVSITEGESVNLLCISKQNFQEANEVRIDVQGPDGHSFSYMGSKVTAWEPSVAGGWAVTCVSVDPDCGGMSSDPSSVVDVYAIPVASMCYRCPDEGEEGVIGVEGGDFDCDDDVTMNDASLWIREYNDSLIIGAQEERMADVDCDGEAKVDDLSVWIRAYEGGN